MNKKIRFFVLNNNILGYMCQDNKRFFGILHSSVLRGATIPTEQGWIYVPEKPVLRSATIKDFNDFRVSYKGYEGDKNYLPLAENNS